MRLELGGKGANIVFDDAPLDAAVNGSAFAIFHNQGQACIAGSRPLLHEEIADEFTEKFLALTKSIRLGNPLDPATEMGPLTSPGRRDRVLNYIQIAREQGSTILTGGKEPADPALRAGCYVEPTVVTAQPSDRVCQEEVFGPFVSVTRFKDEAYRDQVFVYVEKEDTPRPLMFQLDLLGEVGFSQVEVLHKNVCFAAFGAVKA